MQTRPYQEVSVRCKRCKGAGCAGCDNKGFKKKHYYQIEGVDYERERTEEKEELAKAPKSIQDSNEEESQG